MHMGHKTVALTVRSEWKTPAPTTNSSKMAYLEPVAIIQLCTIAYAAWYIASSIVVWRRLRHIPSPSPFATFSHLWLARITFSGQQYWVHRTWHDKYGPLVRVGPNDIVTDDPDIISKICSTRSAYARGSFYQSGRFNPYKDNLLSTLDTETHKRAKARFLGAISSRENPGLELCVNEQVKTLVDIIGKRYATLSIDGKSRLLDLASMSCFLTMDVTTRLAFGEAIGAMRDEKDPWGFFESLRSLWPGMSTSADLPWLRNLLFSPVLLKLVGPNPTDRTGFGALMGIAERFVTERFVKQAANRRNDVLQNFISKGFSQQECEVEGLLLLLSGTESTACAIRAVLVYAIMSPVVYWRLKQEIRDAIHQGAVSSPITLVEAQKLSYLRAVVYEGLRMRPPLLGLWPKVVPSPGETFHGKDIPPGTNLGMNISALLRSKSLFGLDSEIYNPERFIRVDEAERSKIERFVEFAFGSGQWQCAGKTIALMELYKVLFELMRAFDMQLIDPLQPRNIQSYGVFLESEILASVTRDTSLTAA